MCHKQCRVEFDRMIAATLSEKHGGCVHPLTCSSLPLTGAPATCCGAQVGERASVAAAEVGKQRASIRPAASGGWAETVAFVADPS